MRTGPSPHPRSSRRHEGKLRAPMPSGSGWIIASTLASVPSRQTSSSGPCDRLRDPMRSPRYPSCNRPCAPPCGPPRDCHGAPPAGTMMEDDHLPSSPLGEARRGLRVGLRGMRRGRGSVHHPLTGGGFETGFEHCRKFVTEKEEGGLEPSSPREEEPPRDHPTPTPITRALTVCERSFPRIFRPRTSHRHHSRSISTIGSPDAVASSNSA